MIIAYSPEGAEVQSWDLRQVKLMATEAEQIERLTDWTWAEASERLKKGSMIALRAVVFILAKRDEPALKYAQFNPPAGELDYWLDADERDAIRLEVLNSDTLGEDERQSMLAALDELAAEMVKRGFETAAGDSESVPKGSAGTASLSGG